jgi:rhodanese-related sulfurtransferase
MRLLALGFAAAILSFAAADLALVQPKELAAELSAKPAVFHVGFNTLWRNGKHIPGAVYAGPGNRPEGLEALKAAVAKLPKDREIVLYCGCCPWDHCPNIRPAFAALHEMGYTHVRALYIAENFKANWIDAGYPVE